jgi:hydrogenase nickel incorporation protein HypA/HybF
MHEVAIMEQTLAISLSSAEQQNAQKIHLVKMRIGAVSGVVPEALSFAFDVVTQGTIAENAKLAIETVPVVCYCSNCQSNFEPEDFIYQCPNCHQISGKIIAGKEIELTSLEVS